MSQFHAAMFDAGMRMGRRHNDIGAPGGWGFGVGVTPYDRVPPGWEPTTDHTKPEADGYGNYTYLDGSVAVYVPAFYYKWGTGANGLAINAVDIQNFYAFRNRAHAALSGYALHRAFVDGGQVKPGVFVDKYQWSAKTHGGNVVASSIKNGDPLSSNAGRNGWGSLLTGLTTADNIYAGALKAAKTRGPQFFCNSRFIFAALAMLSYAHARASSSTERCGFYLAGANFPKGNNSNNAARTDVNDASVSWTSTGYNFCGLTGSASAFAKSTHNGQNSGIADLNGNVWEVTPGFTNNGSVFYILKESASIVGVTGGATGPSDLWSAAGYSDLHDAIGATYESAVARNAVTRYASTSQAFSAATDGNAWAFAGMGGMLASGASAGGTAEFGNDGFWDYRPSALCPISGGNWTTGANAGVWTLTCYHVRGNSNVNVGGRAACYFDGPER
ncbi:MAG: hypothetical protein EOM22_06895 [Gammaproteobacteria bacterium]|nr:hypothetical protein [Gammaproteobacteria bacterium]